MQSFCSKLQAEWAYEPAHTQPALLRRKKILIGYDTDHCFACGKHNPDGLGLEFCFDRETGIVHSEFTPPMRYQGYGGVVHGGILATLMDEVMAHSLWQRGIAAVTAKMSLRYREPVPVGERLLLYGRTIEERRKHATTEG
ncbi:PaaI family thioesterase [Candidatus Entotheonella palauensis]|uniref:PaaI family thioesterase n=1 Tax=Candidatus Entotheonella palauensis TaxID=93172 RepID=UPI0015C4346A|nr:PaaI family thioesterase [Candidatus Entotheonella palauensis]